MQGSVQTQRTSTRLGAFGPGANFGCLRQQFRPRAQGGEVAPEGVWCGVVLNVGVGDMRRKAKPEGCESADSKEYSASMFMSRCDAFHCMRALKAQRTGTLDGKSLDGGGGIQS